MNTRKFSARASRNDSPETGGNRAVKSQHGELDLIDDILAEHPAPLEPAALNSIYRLAVLDEKLPPRPRPAPAVKAAPDRQIAVAGDWALASDGLQWIVQRRRQKADATAWRAVSFVRTTRAILNRCLIEKGAQTSTAATLLERLPATFAEWAAARVEPVEQHLGAGPVRLHDREATAAHGGMENVPCQPIGGAA